MPLTCQGEAGSAVMLSEVSFQTRSALPARGSINPKVGQAFLQHIRRSKDCVHGAESNRLLLLRVFLFVFSGCRLLLFRVVFESHNQTKIQEQVALLRNGQIQSLLSPIRLIVLFFCRALFDHGDGSRSRFCSCCIQRNACRILLVVCQKGTMPKHSSETAK